MLESITRHWLTEAEGWRTLDPRPEHPFADLVAVNESGEMVLVVCADDADIQRGLCCALGRLLLMMDRDIEVNAFGLPRPDPRIDTPLIRYILAVPAESAWLQLVRALPERVRKMLHLVILRVSEDEVIKYVPGVPV
jgi:hypothetical protein